MKQLTVIFRSNPAFNSKGREALDLAMLSASFEQRVKLIFIDEGIFNLLNGQTPEQLGGKDYISAFKALPLYDIEDIYVCDKSISQHSIKQSELIVDATTITTDRIRTLISEADEVLVF